MSTAVRSMLVHVGVRGVGPYSAQMGAASAATSRMAGATRAVGPAATDAARGMGRLGPAAQRVRGSVAGVNGSLGLLNPKLLGPAGLVLGLSKAVGLSVQFEREFANVRKTVEGTDEELDAVATSIRQMSTEMPTTTTELNAVASAAGQLGVATDQLEAFTREMTMMGVATDLTADDAAFAFARLANITQTPLEDIRELTSVSVALGNQFAAQESEIVDFALRIAGAGQAVGMTTDAVFALSTALPSMGLRAEQGGSSVSRILVEMAGAVDAGGETLEEFARVSGMTATEFQAAWRDDAAGAFLVFLEGLQEAGAAGESTFAIIDELGLSNIRTRDTLLRGSSAAGVYADALGVAADEMETLTALEDEYATFASTTDSKWQVFKNSISEMARSLGDDLKPVADGVLATLNDLFSFGPSGPLDRHGMADPGRRATAEDFRDPTSSDSVGGFFRDLIGLNIAQGLDDLGVSLGVLEEHQTAAGRAAERHNEKLEQQARATSTGSENYATYMHNLGLGVQSQKDVAEALENQVLSFERADNAAQIYFDTLRAATDPVFAFRQAQQDLEQAQRDSEDAVRGLADAQKHLADVQKDSESTARDVEDAQRAVEDAQRDLQDTSWGVADAILAFEEAGLGASGTFADFSVQLQRWVDEGRITAEEADRIRSGMADLNKETQQLKNESPYKFHVEGDMDAAKQELNHVTHAVQDLVANAYTVRINARYNPPSNQIQNMLAGGTPVGRSHSGDVIDYGMPGRAPGLAADERLRILQVGEEVVTARDPRHIENLGRMHSGGLVGSPWAATSSGRASSMQAAPAASVGAGTVVHVPTKVEVRDVDGVMTGTMQVVASRTYRSGRDEDARQSRSAATAVDGRSSLVRPKARV